jgi:sugar phosphate isomerase/epimerase
MMLTRREFFLSNAVAAGIAIFRPGIFAGDFFPDVKFPSDTHDRIAIASYPFREFIVGKEAKTPQSAQIQLEQFAAHVQEKFGVRNIEPWTGHFPSTDQKYLDQFRTALEKSNGFVANIAVDGESSPYALDRKEREQAISFSKKWVDAAAFLRAPGIRTNIPSARDAQPQVERAAESLARVVDYASSKNVVINLENDNPVSEDPFFLVKVVETVGNPWLRTLPDFANSLAHREEEYAYKGFSAMCDHAYSICHVKSMELNDSNNPVHVDMARAFDLLNRSGFKGYCSMEFDSPGDPYSGTKDLIASTIKLLK